MYKFLSIVFFVASLLAFPPSDVFAQRTSQLVRPADTDPNITTNLNNHFVSVNRTVPQRGRLFVMLAGTGGNGLQYLEINRVAADLGFHAFSLTYPNDEAVNTLCGAPNTNLDCYGNVRLETLDGTDRSPLVNVNRANSIENRLIKLIIFLRDRSPVDNWGQFLLNDAELDWTKIVVAGHSQGGGHAGIIGRYKPVARIIMFAAMDFNGLTFSPANWIARPETTPNASTPDKFFGFSHVRDDMVSFNLLSTVIWPAYGMPPFGPIVNVDSTTPPFSNTHQLTTDIDCEVTHGCIVADPRLVRDQNGVPVFKPVWEYLLTTSSAPPVSIGEIRFTKAGVTIPRPPGGLSSKSFRLSVTGTGFDAGSIAVVNGFDVPTQFVSPTTLTVSLPSGPLRPPGRSQVRIRTSAGLLSDTIAF